MIIGSKIRLFALCVITADGCTNYICLQVTSALLGRLFERIATIYTGCSYDLLSSVSGISKSTPAMFCPMPPGCLFTAMQDILILLCFTFTCVLLMHLVPYIYDSHGLQVYPGPFFAKFTDLWLGWTIFSNTWSETVEKLHKKHGMLFALRLSSTSLVSTLLILSLPPSLICKARLLESDRTMSPYRIPLHCCRFMGTLLGH